MTERNACTLALYALVLVSSVFIIWITYLTIIHNSDRSCGVPYLLDPPGIVVVPCRERYRPRHSPKLGMYDDQPAIEYYPSPLYP